MQIDATAVAKLAQRVGAFHITDKHMRSAQDQIEAALSANAIDDQTYRGYLAAVRRYFSGFASEARTHLRDVDNRLEHANQVVFNLTAERGVAVKRIQATSGILDELDTLENHVAR